MNALPILFERTKGSLRGILGIAGQHLEDLIPSLTVSIINFYIFIKYTQILYGFVITFP
jgi:hypothetical protein